MGSKINRGFMFYLFLLLGILLGAFLVCVVIMIFVPDFSLFGIRCFNEKYQDVRIINMSVYDSKDDSQENDSVLLSNSLYTIDKIEINTPVHSVKVFKNNELLGGTNFDQFVVIFNSKNFGFTINKINKSDILVKYYLDTKTLAIDAVGPEGFLSFGENMDVVLQLPPTYITNNIELEINSKKNIKIGDSLETPGNEHPTPISFKSLNLSTERDIVVTNYVNIGESARANCSLKSVNGTITVDTLIRANNLDIEAGESTLTFKEDQSFDLTGKLSIITDGTFVHLGKLNASDIYLKNKYGKIYFNDITGNVIVDKNSFKCDYDFKNINGYLIVGSYLDEDMVEGGKIFVDGNITGDVNITYTGDVDIARISSLTKIKNTNGAINIETVGAAVDIKTVDGNITLGKEASKLSTRVTLETTGKGKIKAYFSSFAYAEDIDSTITTKNGEIEIYLVENMSKNINATTTAKLNYFGADVESKTGTWTEGEAKLLTINSKANIRISK